MNKYLIAGGAAVAGLVGFVVIHRKRSAASSNDSQQTPSYLPPVSGGVATDLSGATPVPSSGGAIDSSGVNVAQPSLQAPASTMGGASFDDLMSKIFTGNFQIQHEKVVSNEHINDSMTLAGINLGDWGGSSSVSHTADGTTLNVQKSDPVATQRKSFVDSLYTTEAKRTPDAGGEAYWIGRLNEGASYDQVTQAFRDSVAKTTT